LDLSLPRGIRDIEPAEFDLHERIREAFAAVSRSYNFMMMDPAPIEHLSVLRAKSGEDVDDEIYAFKDKGGRDIGLRFDLTVGLTRYVCGRKDLRPPVKLAAFGGAWRYDEPQHARYRWFNQWDLEVFGRASFDSDAEVIDATAAIFRRLGIGGVKVKIGDRRVVEEFISKRLGIDSEERVAELMRALDKVQKKTRPELIREYSAKGFSAGDLGALFDFGDTRGEPAEVLGRLQGSKLEAVEGFSSLVDALAGRRVGGIELDLSIVRGIDYYTGVVFEVVDEKQPGLGSLAGGGRYDRLPRAFGRDDLSATGAAGGIERIAMALGGVGTDKGLVFVAAAGEDLFGEALKIASELRAADVPTEVSQRKPLAKQLEDASKAGASWTVIVGRKELAEGVVLLRKMSDRTEERLTFEDAVRALKSAAR
jgi:histidyl-tRNA synthetase